MLHLHGKIEQETLKNETLTPNSSNNMEKAIRKSIEGGKRDYMRKPQGWDFAGSSWQCGLSSKNCAYFPQIDENDVSLVSKYRWYLKDGYAVTSIKGKRVRMHHLIFGKPPKGKVTDHINRDRLDNRRVNLHFNEILK